MPEGTLSLSSGDRRHIKLVYFEKTIFRKTKGSGLRYFEYRCDKSRDNLDFLWDDFRLANQGVLWGKPPVENSLGRFEMRCVCQPMR